jgi:two-component system, chemotaxis family, protein-glutamate methylesterase/glutaminase
VKGLPIIVMGSSAGGLDALKRLVAQLPRDFPAPIFVVNHMAADGDAGILSRALSRIGELPCSQARDEEEFRPGHIYVAPADHHMLLDTDVIRITKGARENRARPAIDPLFRSAAVAHGNRVTGVILTGYLDDGTAGLNAVHRCGGICVVQDPDDAAYPDMPRSALRATAVDHCVPLDELGALLTELVHRSPGPRVAVPDDVALEARIARSVLSDLPSVNTLGHQVPFNCPDCGGVLWEIEAVESLRFRCHTGHAFTVAMLREAQESKIEETLWYALRQFEERKNLLRKMADRSNGSSSESLEKRAEESEVHIERIRAMLKAGSQGKSQVE